MLLVIKWIVWFHSVIVHHFIIISFSFVCSFVHWIPSSCFALFVSTSMCDAKKRFFFYLGQTRADYDNIIAVNKYHNLNWNVWISCLNACNRHHNWFERDKKKKRTHNSIHSNQLKTILRAFTVSFQFCACRQFTNRNFWESERNNNQIELLIFGTEINSILI